MKGGTNLRRRLVLVGLLSLLTLPAGILPASAQGTIGGFAPTHGPEGTVVIISGTGFTGSTDVRFAGVTVGAGNFTVDSDIQISAAVPVGAVTGPIKVDTPAETLTSADPFVVDTTPAPPVIAAIAPTQGPEGAPVVITGSGFSDAVSVTFGGVDAQYTVDSDAQITTSVPAGAPTAPITVTTPAGTATSVDPFVVQPNIVFILSDDQRFDEMANMPTVHSELVGKGVTFQNGFVSDPLCCPSRASILTGQYPGTTGVWDNVSPYDFDAFNDGSTVATWLHSGGYNTALIGKYLNGYGPNTTYVPPGWDRWVAFDGAGHTDGRKYYNYKLSVDGSDVAFGSDPADYSTDVLANYSDSFIRNAPADQPLFLYFTPFAPHGPSIPPARHVGAFAGFPIAHSPSFNEADVSDKPAYIQSKSLLTSTQIANSDQRRRSVLETLLGMDDAAATIIKALSDTGRLSNTLIFYMSDNGLSDGEHRWKSKRVPYEGSIRVPLVVRWDRLPDVPRTSPKLAANIDIAPTIADAAGVTPGPVDGSSLLPLLDGSAATWRSGFLIEALGSTKIPSYCGVRDDGSVFVHYATGEEEYYDLTTDPDELVNQVANPHYRADVEAMRSQARNLCDPLPPGMNPF